MKRIALILTIALFARVTSAQIVSDAEIRKILIERVDAQQQSVDLVVGVIEPAGSRAVAYGKSGLDGDTLF